jgi:protein Tex
MADNKFVKIISEELTIKEWQVNATIALLDDGATIPFISRYRKEMTGSLDEVEVANIRDRNIQLEDLEKRRKAIIKSLEERDLLTDELKLSIEEADSMVILEDLYLPYKPKRRTRATIAREKGLEELALQIFDQNQNDDPFQLASDFIDPEKDVEDEEAALAGARDIIAEIVNEDGEARSEIRELFHSKSLITSRVAKGKDEIGQKYKDYFEWSESVSDCPSHRMLAMRRGEKEEILYLQFQPDEDAAIEALKEIFVISDCLSSEQVRLAVSDSYKRLMSLSMETELRLESKKIADLEAIQVFVENLRQLLLSAPLGEKRVLALDPGWRTGCKVVCLDAQGALLANTTIYPHSGENASLEAGRTVCKLIEDLQINAIAIGNGTAGRETETWVNNLNLSKSIIIVMVDESGASIYSASEVARKEFPDHDITVRGSVSIGRRLQDPLAELVKIDPKSIGVGQYQHDVDQRELRKSLQDVVESCVNAVGVEMNTASGELLSHISGIGTTLADNIVAYRNENGPFKSRKEFLKVPRMGPKVFEQSAGFLRIRNAKNRLDSSAIHPESYKVVEQMAKDMNSSVSELMQNSEIHDKINLKRYVTDSVGIPTLTDILQELEKPSRDPREQFEVFQFAEGVNKMEDLEVGMRLPGIVTNITRFGCFVDIGVHQDGLVHISQMADKFVKDPQDVVKLREHVNAKVLEIDIPRKRISLSFR